MAFVFNIVSLTLLVLIDDAFGYNLVLICYQLSHFAIEFCSSSFTVFFVHLGTAPLVRYAI